MDGMVTLSPPASAASRLLPRGAAGLLLAALWLSETTAAFGSSMTYAATRSLLSAFGDPITVGWLTTVFLLVGAAAAPVAARFGDLMGRKRVLLVVMGAGGLGLLLGAVSGSYPLALIGRGLEGLHLATMPLALGILRDAVRPARFPLAVGLILSAVASGTLTAMLLGGWAADMYGWRAVFAIGAVGALLSWIGLALFTPDHRGTADGVPGDLASVALAVPAIAGMLFVASSLSTRGWRDPLLAALFVGSVLLAFAWVARSLRLSNPLVDFRLFARRQVLIVNLVYICASLGAFQVILFLAMLMQAPVATGAGLGLTARMAGLATIPAAALSLVAAPVGGILVERFGGRAVMILSGIVMTAGFLFTSVWHHSLAVVTFDFCFITIGTTALFAAGPPVLIAAVPAERTSEALGMMTVLRAIATAAGAQLVAVLLASKTSVDPASGSGRYPTAGAFALTLEVLIALSALTVVLAMAAGRERGRGAAVLS
jgi:MFS family permease